MAQLGLRRYLGVVEIVGSNPAAPIPFYLEPVERLSSPDNIQQKGQNQAHQDHGRDRDEDRQSLTPINNVPREPPEPRNLPHQKEKSADEHQDNSDVQDHSSQGFNCHLTLSQSGPGAQTSSRPLSLPERRDKISTPKPRLQLIHQVQQPPRKI